jgi:hypothetical protein
VKRRVVEKRERKGRKDMKRRVGKRRRRRKRRL